jgi:hypothetical protein
MILDGLRGVLISSSGLRDYRLGIGRGGGEQISVQRPQRGHDGR